MNQLETWVVIIKRQDSVSKQTSALCDIDYIFNYKCKIEMQLSAGDRSISCYQSEKMSLSNQIPFERKVREKGQIVLNVKVND